MKKKECENAGWMQKKETEEKDPYRTDTEGTYFTCSSTDCTGLIPAGMISEAERESYEELYPSLTPPALLKKEE